MEIAYEKARLAIGDGAPDDFKLEPARHAAKLPPEAGALKRVLNRPAISEVIGRYIGADREALAAQARYRRLGALAIYALSAPAVLGALLVLKDLAPDLEQGPERLLRQLVLGLQFLAIAISIACGLFLSQTKPFDRWMRARGEAEQARQDLFEEIIIAEEAHNTEETPYRPLALAYYRRYQLDMQRAYYRVRSKEALIRTRRMRGGQALTLALLLISGLPLAAAIWGALSGQGVLLADDVETSLIALGALGGGIASTLSALSLLHLDRRNASKYVVARDNLDYLADEKMAAAVAATLGDDPRALYAFVQQVHEVISSEHREWVEIWRHRRRLNELILKLPDAPAGP